MLGLVVPLPLPAANSAEVLVLAMLNTRVAPKLALTIKLFETGKGWFATDIVTTDSLPAISLVP